jgi:hypothetical protein
MPWRRLVEQLLQKVHSNEQIMASPEFGGNAAPHFSQFVFMSSMVISLEKSTRGKTCQVAMICHGGWLEMPIVERILP